MTGVQTCALPILDHVPTSRFVVLLDGATDQVAIGEQSRHAWANMRADSPNNRPDASPVRFVLVEAPKRREIGQQSTDSTFPEEFSEAYGDLEAMRRRSTATFRAATASSGC